MAGTLALLGPQRPTPNISQVLATLPGDGRVVTITAGWRHEEGETEALHRAIGPSAVSLPLYAMFEEVMARAPQIADEWRARQAKLMELKHLHRLRLYPALEALRRLLDKAAEGSAVAGPQLQWSLDHLRDLDQQFLDHSGVLLRQHPEVLSPWEHPAAAAFYERAAEILGAARAVLIAGGHVAVLRNRLEFFGIHHLLRRQLELGTSVVAWSAGAMALTERIVLFYDDPPEGQGHPELLDRGFELARGLVLLPHCRRRLQLDDRERVSLLATRLGPAWCVGVECGAWLEKVGRRWVNRGERESALLLGSDGSVSPLAAPREKREDGEASLESVTPPPPERSTGRRAPTRTHSAPVGVKRVQDLLARCEAAPARTGEEIKAFIRDNTFPLFDNDTAIFFFYDERPLDSVHLLHWVFGLESRQAFIPLGSTGAWYLPLDLPRAARVEYKLEIVRGGNRLWIRDPFNPNRAFDPFGSNSVCTMPGYVEPKWAQPEPGVRPGARVTFTLASAIYGDEREVQVYLPVEYKPHKKYPLLICHDGRDYLRFASIKNVLDNLIQRHEVAPLLVAFTSGVDRNREYGANPKQPVFLVDELLPELQRRFGVAEGPGNLGLMGASFGAVASLHAAWTRPGVFGKLLLQSGSFVHTDIGRHDRGPLFDPVVEFTNAYRADPARVKARIYMSCGTFESLIWFNRSLRALMVDRGVDVRFVEAQDGHNWIAWRDRLREGLSLLFPGHLWMYYD